MAAGKLACTYASLILHDDGIEITAEKINNLVKAANVSVESYWPSLSAKLAEKKNIEDLILNAGSVAVAPAGGDATAATAAVENEIEDGKKIPED